ncbi:hypothetical protein DBV05_g11040 [Lasiodiplodia theobromae]|uniref:Heterokaryon incompatibility domain-containing protein n=1 Tax=Lasiodiplodia theobromae TaxID=45133 RepID=A0A5N5CY50_9PEZI|nr:hypothetical protein DBV05_g11040 [Lasiodiplodia theobromae]
MDAPNAQLCAECTKVIQDITAHDPNSIPQIYLADFCSTISSCSLCYFVNQVFQEEGYGKDLEPCDDDEGRRLLRERYFQLWVRQGSAKDPIHFQEDDMPGICIMEIKYNRNSHEYACFIFDGFERYVRFSAEPGSPAATSGKVHAGPTITASGSPESFAHLNTLYSGCLEHHAECRKTLGGTTIDESQPPDLPAHILDLGDDPSSTSIRLLQPSQGQRGHYAALSYRRDPSTTTTTTPASANIPLSTLPQAFQDAVTTTRALNLRYLWIDDLCLPPSPTSPPQTGPIFTHARILLAASDAATPSAGLFRTYPTRPAITLPFLDAEGKQAGTILAELRPDESILDPEQGPLNRSAWATQQYILARRVAYFTAGAVVWSCRHCPHRALWDDGVLWYAYGRTKTKWARLVMEYSTRELEVRGEKLVALEGVVGELAKIRGKGQEGGEKEQKVECVYGTWTDALASHVLWSRVGRPGSMSRPAELEAVAPTWSWASTEGGVHMTEFEFGDIDTDSDTDSDDDGDDGDDKSDKGSRTPRANAELAIDEEDKRRIRVKGKLGRVELRVIEDPDPYMHPCDCQVHSEDGKLIGMASTDVGLGEGVKTATAFCLAVLFHPYNFSGGSYLTLFVQPREDGSDHYVRMGNGAITKKKWVDQLGFSELYLV